MARSVLAALLLGAAFFFAPSLLPGADPGARAQSFGCQVGFRQQPRVWIYTDTEGSAGRLDSVAISETLGAVLESLAPPRRRPAYSFEVVRNNDAHRLLEDLDLLTCVSGKRLNVAVDALKILKFPEAPQSFTLLTFSFTLQDQGKIEDKEPVELGPFRFLLPNPRDGEALAGALTPIVAERLADCVFQDGPACQGGS